jgi:ADP-ribosylglycohydrolase
VGQEAVAIALYAVLTAGSYVEAIRIASNHDGDSDSTASIAGQMWGAWKGVEGSPCEWITNLDVLVPALRPAREALDSSSLV